MEAELTKRKDYILHLAECFSLKPHDEPLQFNIIKKHLIEMKVIHMQQFFSILIMFILKNFASG